MRTIANCLIAGLMLLAVAASAQIPDPDESYVSLGPDGGMTTCPGADAPPYQYVTVHAHEANGAAIPGIPSWNFFFTITGGNVFATAVGTATDEDGEIQFRLVANETVVLLDPHFLVIECQINAVVLNDIDYLEVNSYDMNEDGCVALVDFAEFAAVYLTADPSGDFNWDGFVDLPDFAYFAAHYLHGDCR